MSPVGRRRLAVIESFHKLMARAHREGLDVVVDSDAIAVRFIPSTVVKSGADLREEGITVRVDNACGSTTAKVSGRACNDGNL